MTELYLIELLYYMDQRAELLGEPEHSDELFRLWQEHLTHEYEHPDIFNDGLMPVWWYDNRVEVEDL